MHIHMIAHQIARFHSTYKFHPGFIPAIDGATLEVFNYAGLHSPCGKVEIIR